MAASNTDLVRNATPTFSTTLSGSISSSDTSMGLSSVSGLPTGTGITLTIDATNASGISTPTVKETITGVVSGSDIVDLLRGKDSTTAQSHATGAIVTMWVTANLWNDFQTSFLNGHGQLGTHKALKDTNGNPWIGQTATGSAVNNLNVANAATGNAVTLSAIGSDTNISINVTPKGAGTVNLPALLLSGSLTGTGLASQVQSYTNTGNGAGTGYYINLGGIKLCWGVSGSFATSGSANISASFPVSPTFFTTVEYYDLSLWSPTVAGATTAQNSVTTTAIAMFTSTTMTTSLKWFIIGT